MRYVYYCYYIYFFGLGTYYIMKYRGVKAQLRHLKAMVCAFDSHSQKMDFFIFFPLEYFQAKCCVEFRHLQKVPVVPTLLYAEQSLKFYNKIYKYLNKQNIKNNIKIMSPLSLTATRYDCGILIHLHNLFLLYIILIINDYF